MKENFRNNLEKAIQAKSSVSEYCTITIENDWTIKVYAHPSESKLHQVVAALTSLTGRLEKKQAPYGTEFQFIGNNEDFHVTVITPERCKIVGYKIAKRPKRVIVETAEIEEVKTPVTDCDFRAGKVKAGEFEPILAEVVA
jgi:hypothetical protein